MPQTDVQSPQPSPRSHALQTEAVSGSSPGWMRSFLLGLIIWAATRATFLLIGAYSFKLYGQPVPWTDMWVQWDAHFYLDIAERGYQPPTVFSGLETGQSNINFFPLLPVMIAIVHMLGLDARLAGLITVNVCLLIAAIVLHRMATQRADARVADWTLLSLMTLPGSFGLSGPLSESPFLAFSVAATFLASARPGISAIFSGLLTISRWTGILQGIGLALDWLIERIRGGVRGSYSRLLPIALIPIPLLLFLAYMFYLTGDALAPLHSNFAFWKQHFEIPFQSLFLFLHTQQPRLQIQSLVALALVLITLSQARFFSAGEMFFVVASVLSYTSSEAASPSLIRYTIGLYPVHLAIGKLCGCCVPMRVLLVCLAMAGSALAAIWFHGSESYV
jgi:hypothetical protein